MDKLVKTLIILSLLVLLGGAGAGGYYYYHHMLKANFAGQAGQETPHSYDYVDIKNIMFSVEKGNQNRTVLIDLTIESKDPEVSEKITDVSSVIKSKILGLFNAKPYMEQDEAKVFDYVNKSLNKELKPLLEKYLGKGKTGDILITKLLIQ